MAGLSATQSDTLGRILMLEPTFYGFYTTFQRIERKNCFISPLRYGGLGRILGRLWGADFLRRERSGMGVIAVFNQKGGVGKTTTCLNLAAAWVRAGANPLLLDLDPQSHLSLASGVVAPPGAGMAAFFQHQTPLLRLLERTRSGWDLIPATADLSKIDALKGGDPKAATLLSRGMNAVVRERSPILMDCCPNLGVLTLNALLAADYVLIPVAADYLSLQGVYRIESALDVLEKRLKRTYPRRIVVTRFNPRRRLAFEVDRQLRERYGEDVCKTRIAENVALATSPSVGQDVFRYAPHSGGASDYAALAKELSEAGFLRAVRK
ncbi:ParA family protein [Ferrovum sp.]|uniref:ParA family protein n=1 Tax=Ferrovum sp. TaxID=2609467 RepID=UPI002636AF92|nr:ParA family protein [Ferrovum sp.]